MSFGNPILNAFRKVFGMVFEAQIRYFGIFFDIYLYHEPARKPRRKDDETVTKQQQNHDETTTNRNPMGGVYGLKLERSPRVVLMAWNPASSLSIATRAVASSCGTVLEL